MERHGGGAFCIFTLMGGRGNVRRLLFAAALIVLGAVGGAARDRGVVAPWRVGIQAGHWQIDQLPDEQRRLAAGYRGAVGLAHRGSGEPRDRAEDRAPAPGGRSLRGPSARHGAPRRTTRMRSWQSMPTTGAGPRRAGGRSPRHGAPRRHRASCGTTSQRRMPRYRGFPEDRYGISYNMKGYYGFSWYRFEHAVAPTTPAAIIETGFLTSAADRALIVSDPERTARGIAQGIIAYLGELSPSAGLRPGADRLSADGSGLGQRAAALVPGCHGADQGAAAGGHVRCGCSTRRTAGPSS